ncbi:pantoate--beta-alanine ligase [Flavobacterium crassostreae]|uniref:Pantothenate synthetase n=1 Tax=Flavobacterium crassostreae TaxID=1763534 RepID=A0A1B9E086_9FLAO|nr:pantoate--beta-alanine ligase [Flavobacterium crassostreae]OCB75362.1 pantoate--beta-alanine ligase [Flavobacterium crassostreae]
MHIFNEKAPLIAHLANSKNRNATIGFVPTMGALHQGHLSLMQQSISENAITVVSIFVNPTQFNNAEDLLKYPRTLEQDVQKIALLNPDIIIFAPTVTAIYDHEISSQEFDFDGLEHQMEGKFRPGHFDGVGTVVKKLFEIVTPTKAYFGEKDFQQLQIIKKMVAKNHLPVKVVGCAIYREPSGLAMSSRNERLTPTEREKAANIYQILLKAKEAFRTQSPQEVSQLVEHTLANHPDFELEYFQIAEEETLLPCLTKKETTKYRAFIALFINKIRLIDTLSLN